MKKKLMVLGLVGIAIVTVIGTVYAASTDYPFGNNGVTAAHLLVYGDSGTLGGRVMFHNGNSYDNTVDYYVVGPSTAFPGDFSIRAVNPSGGPWTVFRVLDTNRKTLMNYGLELWNYPLLVEEGIELGTNGAKVANDGGDVVITLGN